MLSDSYSTTFFLFLIALVLIGGLSIQTFLRRRPSYAAVGSSVMTGLAFLGCFYAWAVSLPSREAFTILGYRATELSWVLATLILFTSFMIQIFSLRYMAGDRRFSQYFFHLTLVSSAILSSAASDHLILFLASLAIAYFNLVGLMVHKHDWSAAKEAGRLAGRTFGLGLVFVSAAGIIFASSAESLSMTQILQALGSYSIPTKILGALCLILGSLAFSGLWPFHRFLMSSANSPTPVSAFMHAGLINGGGVILVRFAPLYADSGWFLNLILLFGLFAVTLGTFWKLIQTDIKRMLACSTMAQMGFMFIQCGLGLFPAAIAHLCWHGVFKSYLFLRSGSTLEESVPQKQEEMTFIRLIILLTCGVFGGIGFMSGSFYPLSLNNGHVVLVIVACVGGMQLGGAVLGRRQTIQSFFSVSVLCLGMGWLYAASVGVIEKALGRESFFVSPALNLAHIALAFLILIPWALMQFGVFAKLQRSSFWKRVYLAGLNGSQPHPKTMTAHWADYQY